MLITIPTPAGMDAAIYAVQSFLHDRLITLWNINTAQYMCYGRCYRNKKNNGYVAEVYSGSNEYKEVYWDDTKSVVSFFGIGTTIEYKLQQIVPVHLVVFADLAKLRPDSTIREDENVRWDFLNILNHSPYMESIKSTVTGIENVLAEYPGSYRDDRLKAVDMHPVHCFRINFELTYNNNDTCSITSNF